MKVVPRAGSSVYLFPESSMRKWRICTFPKSVIGKLQNTSSLTGGEAEFHIAVCVGVLRNSTFSLFPFFLMSSCRWGVLPHRTTQACRRQRTTHRCRRPHITLVCRLQRISVDCLSQRNTQLCPPLLKGSSGGRSQYNVIPHTVCLPTALEEIRWCVHRQRNACALSCPWRHARVRTLKTKLGVSWRRLATTSRTRWPPVIRLGIAGEASETVCLPTALEEISGETSPARPRQCVHGG